jgi:hypothetical protein
MGGGGRERKKWRGGEREREERERKQTKMHACLHAQMYVLEWSVSV